MFHALVLAAMIGDSVAVPADYGDSSVMHEDVLAWECTDPAPPQMRHLAFKCQLWRYEYSHDDGDE